MNHARARRRALLLTSGLAAAALSLAPGSAALAAPTGPSAVAAAHVAMAPAAPPTAGLNYVALGDSYSAGYGITPITNKPVPGCDQAQQNYPHQLATALGLNLTDVTCSGAVTANIIGTPQVTADGTAPAQSDALSASTDIVTVTIGGNDLGFSTIAETCVALSATGPTVLTAADQTPADNCKSIYAPGGNDSLATKIHDVVAPRISDTLSVIHDKAPNAKIFVVGYPALAPNQASGCFTSVIDGLTFQENSFPFTNVDVPYLNTTESQLDTAIQAAATAAGATFVPLFDQTTGNTPCAGNVNSYINGISLSWDAPGIPFTYGGVTVYLKYGALHPNATGVSFLEDKVQAAIEAAVSAPVITSGDPLTALLGDPYSFQVTASGFPAPTFSVSSGSLPPNLQLDQATGEISGTPTATGTSTFTITATNSAGTAVSPEYTLGVFEAPTITNGAPPSAVVGIPYEFQLTASGYPAPTFSYSGMLPDGLHLDGLTGEITGTPTTPGSSTFAVNASNPTGGDRSPDYTITVAAPVAPTITSGAPPAATVGTAYSFQVTATGSPVPTFAVTSGALPAGLKLDAQTGKITGKPTTAGAFSFTIAADNTIEPASSADYTLTVKGAAIIPLTPTDAALAVTGSDLLPAGLLGALVVVAGAGLLLVRRRSFGR